MELIFSHALAHGRCATDSTRDHLLQFVHIGRATPFLVLDHVDALLHFGLLDQLAVRTHAHLAVRLGELIANQRRRVETSERNELPAVAKRCQAANVRLLFCAWHGCLPVE